MPKTQSLKGNVAKVLFSNPENGFAVCRLVTTDGRDAIIAGLLFDAAQGESLEVEGTWEQTPRGPRFAVSSFRFLLPTTKNGIRRYLASGVVPGIGNVMAGRIVEKFGAETIAVLDVEPEQLTEVEGIGKKRAKAIIASWQTRRGLRNLTIFLQGAGVPGSLAPKIMKQLGAKAVKIIKENPYEPALRVRGIGFATADKIAESLGVAKDSPQRAAAGIIHVLNELLSEGHSGYPLPDLLDRCSEILSVPEMLVENAVPELVDRGLISVDAANKERDPYVFLTPMIRAEKEIAGALQFLARGKSRLRSFEKKKAIAWLKKQHGIALTPRQAEAVVAACTEKILVITGGPGTGKTTIIKAITEVLEILDGHALLAAPTGRAAKRLSEATGHEAKTIHRLFALTPGMEAVRKRDLVVDPDILILDEASMIDLPVMAAILNALGSNTHLVLVGDVDQLPSVGPGEVLNDIIRSSQFPVIRLNEIFRQDESGLIVENAHRVLQGKDPVLPAPDQKSDFYFIKRDNPAGVVNTVVELVTERLPKSFGLDPMSDIMVLSPMHKGDTGVKNLNDTLQKRLNPDGDAIIRGDRTFRLGDRVLQTANDYDRDVFNGDLGRVVHVDLLKKSLVVDFDGKRVPVQGADLSDLIPAYAISIHKSQGSECPAVVVVLSMHHFIMLKRNLLYTAITRAKSLVVVVGSKRALGRAIRNDQVGKRFGLLKERLTALTGS